MRYLIAYDISSPGRLRRVARCMEAHAVRIQKSVFIANMSHDEITQLLDRLNHLIAPEYDIIQAFRLATDQPADGFLRGNTVPAEPDSFIHDRSSHFVSRRY